MKYPLKRAVHFDFHTMPGIYNFHENWDAEQFAKQLEDAHVKYINAFAKCNLGFAYYPTKVGIPYQGMKGDMFGDTLRECHKRGIGVTAYFNLGLDHEMARLHRDWCKVNKDGQVLWGDRTGNFFRVMCLNSGYGDYMKDMIRELITLYPEVDGVFLDCITMWAPCHGNECLEEIRNAGKDPLSDAEVISFTRKQTLSYCKEIREIIGDRNMISNGLGYYLGQPTDSHVEVECLPSGWSYDYFDAAAAYARNLQKDVLYMTGRFQRNWGDFGGLKSKASLEYDVWDAIRNGIGCSIGDHLHPTEIMDRQVVKVVGEIYSDVEKMERWTDGARYRADIGVVVSTADSYPATPANNGVARMLGELHYGFDLINETMDFSKYKLLLLPDELRLNGALKKKIGEFVASGKPVLSTGLSALDETEPRFALKEWALEVDGLDDASSPYYQATAPYERTFTDFIYSAYRGGVLMRAKDEKATVYADYVKAYFNKVWDGFHGYFYMPPEKKTGHHAAVRTNNVCHICFKVFTAYYHEAYIAHKQLVKQCLADLFSPSFTSEGIPSSARVTVTETDAYALLHVKATHPEPRGKMNIIEEHTVLPEGCLVHLDGEYAKAYTVPDQSPVPLLPGDGTASVVLPRINGYCCICLEK